jgi:hypothetical protein
MKTSRINNNKQSKQAPSHKPRPEIRDDMDSRKTKDITPKIPEDKKGKKNY